MLLPMQLVERLASQEVAMVFGLQMHTAFAQRH
jgi:hypothetical protein